MMTDYQFKAVANLFLDIVESSKDKEEAKVRIEKILKESSRKSSDDSE